MTSDNRLEQQGFWRWVLGVNLGGAAIATLVEGVLHGLGALQLGQEFLYSLLFANLIGCLMAAMFELVGKSLYRLRFPLNWISIISVIIACSAAGSLAGNLMLLAVGLRRQETFWADTWGATKFATVIGLAVGISAFAYSVLRGTLEDTTQELHQRQLAEERALKLAAEAQLASLESRVRPHFLFNTLNTISALIPEDPKLAEALVGRLAALLRLSLDANPGKLVSLAQELKITTDYLEIERARFGDRLQYQMVIEDGLQTAEVPPLSLQTLAENSVKHAVSTRLDASHIVIRAESLNGVVHMEVSDDGPGFSPAAIRPGHGLDNLQGRLDALFGAQAGLEIEQLDGRMVVRMTIPRHAAPFASQESDPGAKRL
jgi:signal transduction histidine kinase